MKHKFRRADIINENHNEVIAASLQTDAAMDTAYLNIV